MDGWLVTGTGAGVGKTVVAAVLCALRVQLGREVVYVKPVQPGAADGEDDAADVAALTGVPTVTGPLLGPSLPPGAAARRGGAELRGEELAGVVTEAAAGHPSAELVVEGVGGLLEELGSDGTTCADLAGALGLPLLIVTPPGVGSHNVVALTLEVAEHRDLDVAGIVVSSDLPDREGSEDVAELARSTGAVIGALPRLDLSPAEVALAGAVHLGPALGGRWSPPV